MAEIGELDTDETSVFEQLGDFLTYIERGAYTKSYKLVTLRVMAEADGLWNGMPIRSIAEAARWTIDRGARLRRDLFDAGFATASRPTVAKWDAYWRRNPIKALTRPVGGRADSWFAVTNDRLTLAVDLPERLRPIAHEMVRELVEYRLHRYLIGRATKRAEEKRKPRDSTGRELDATFSIEHEADAPIALFYESSGGARGSGKTRNLDYVDGFDHVLVRMRNARLTIEDAYVASTRASDLPILDRRMDPGEGLTYPIDLGSVDDLVALRRSLLRSMGTVGRPPGASGSGNPRKAMRLVFSGAEGWMARDLADTLAGMKSRPVGPHAVASHTAPPATG